jgi:hypothetical protein
LTSGYEYVIIKYTKKDKKEIKEMTQYTENAISPTFRTTVRANNITVWTIESESGYTYSVTLFEGKVTSCQREGGTTCPGFFHRGTCHHAKLVMEREAERREKFCDRCNKPTTEYRVQSGERLCEKCIRELERSAGMKSEYLPPLHGSKGFSLLK